MTIFEEYGKGLVNNSHIKIEEYIYTQSRCILENMLKLERVLVLLFFGELDEFP